MDIIGIILAGGQSSRMGGGDKTLLTLNGEPILAKVIKRVKPQVSHLLLNVNGDVSRFSRFNLPVFQDEIEGFQGPLAGILAGMDYVKTHFPAVKTICTFPADSPFLPLNLVSKMVSMKNEKALDFVSVKSNGQTHPIIGLWDVARRDDLAAFLSENKRKIDRFTHQYKVDYVEFSHIPFDPFFNCNTKEELAEAENMSVP